MFEDVIECVQTGKITKESIATVVIMLAKIRMIFTDKVQHCLPMQCTHKLLTEKKKSALSLLSLIGMSASVISRSKQCSMLISCALPEKTPSTKYKKKVSILNTVCSWYRLGKQQAQLPA